MNTNDLSPFLQQSLPHILIIEDDLLLQEIYVDLLHKHFQLYAAYTIEEALGCFHQYQDTFVAIVVDACVPGNVPNTPPLVRHMRETGFVAPIFATSSNPTYVEELLVAGCSHQCEKKDVAKTLIQILQ